VDPLQGWNMAFTDASQKVLSAEEIDARIAERLPADGLMVRGNLWTCF